MELTLAQLFGVNVFQDSQILRINKSDLPLLTPNINNTAESLLVAILLNALRNFSGTITDENNQTITDENNNSIEFDNRGLYRDISIFRWDDQLISKDNILCTRKTIIIHEFINYED